MRYLRLHVLPNQTELTRRRYGQRGRHQPGLPAEVDEVAGSSGDSQRPHRRLLSAVSGLTLGQNDSPSTDAVGRHEPDNERRV